MNSRIVGRLQEGREAYLSQSDRILSLDFNAAYAEFLFGRWKNCVFYNASGLSADHMLHEYSGGGRFTDLASRVPFVQELTAQTFHTTYLKWVRAFVLEDGLLLPHRDYLEMDTGFTRLHLVLKTNAGCLHSEEDDVFHMRAGEIWFLEARKTHCACNFGDTPRVTLCFDFMPDIPFTDLFADAATAAALPALQRVDRDNLAEREIRDVLRGEYLNPGNLRDVAASLARLHFTRRANAGAMFDWLQQLAEESPHAATIPAVAEMRKWALGTEGKAVT